MTVLIAVLNIVMFAHILLRCLARASKLQFRRRAHGIRLRAAVKLEVVVISEKSCLCGLLTTLVIIPTINTVITTLQPQAMKTPSLIAVTMKLR